MTSLDTTQARIRSQAATIFSEIRSRAQQSLADEAAERRAQEARRADELRERALAKKRLRKQLRRRVTAALRGIENLLELSAMPELQALAELLPRHTFTEGQIGDDPSAFTYYGAVDDQEHVFVFLAPGRVVVEIGGVYAQYRGYYEFTASCTSVERARRLYRFASHLRRPPFAVARVFDQKGDNGDLEALAFQVLVEASNARRIQEYMDAALKHITFH